MRVEGALACVMGDMDLLRPLGTAGIPCAIVARPLAPPRFSRFARAAVDWYDAWEQPDALVARLDLPVPRARHLRADRDAAEVWGLRFPLILKPLTRRTDRWGPVAGGAKALRVDAAGQLRALW